MREIKFRAWLWSDNHTNDQWIYSDKLGMIKFWQSFYSWTAHKDLMQYTDLKDKNGKMICEGDIVIIQLPYYKKSSVIKWNKDRAGFYEGDTCWEIGIYKNNLTIIGNIHDNPELLTE